MGLAQLENSVVIDVVSATESSRPREQFEMVVSILERLADPTAVMAATLLAYFVYTFLEVGKRIHYPTPWVVAAGFIFAVAFVVLLDHDDAYVRANSLLRIRETERILRVCAKTFGVALSVTFFFAHPFSRWVVILAAVIVPLLLAVEKQLVFLIIRHLHSRGYGLQNVLVYGAGFTGRRVFSALVSSPKIGLNPVAVVDDDRQLVGQEIFQYGYRRER